MFFAWNKRILEKSEIEVLKCFQFRFCYLSSVPFSLLPEAMNSSKKSIQTLNLVLIYHHCSLWNHWLLPYKTTIFTHVIFYVSSDSLHSFSHFSPGPNWIIFFCSHLNAILSIVSLVSSLFILFLSNHISYV